MVPDATDSGHVRYRIDSTSPRIPSVSRDDRRHGQSRRPTVPKEESVRPSKKCVVDRCLINHQHIYHRSVVVINVGLNRSWRLHEVVRAKNDKALSVCGCWEGSPTSARMLLLRLHPSAGRPRSERIRFDGRAETERRRSATYGWLLKEVPKMSHCPGSTSHHCTHKGAEQPAPVLDKRKCGHLNLVQLHLRRR